MSDQFALFPAIAGPPGTQGPPGTNGANGANGIDGSTWYYGSDAPSALHAEGDLYINTSTDNIYCQQSGAWVLVGNIKGTQGIQGPPGDFPAIQYAPPVFAPDNTYFDIDLTASALRVFKVHILAVVGGSIPSDGNLTVLRLNNALVAVDGSLLGTSEYGDSSGVGGNAEVINPFSLDVVDTLPGDIFDITMQTRFPYDAPSAPMSIMSVESRWISPSRANRTNIQNSFIALPGARINSVGLGFFSTGTVTLTFDPAQTVYAKLLNSY